MDALLVLGLRILIPLGILRYPLVFGLLAVFFDAVDVILMDAIQTDSLPVLTNFFHQNYHALDKWLDTYYLGIAFLVSLKWKEVLAKRTSIVLFLWRLAGVIAFELTHLRAVLFFAPNLFENFFFFYLIARKIKPGWEIKTKKRLFIILGLLYIPKFFQEYLLHVMQAQPWNWLKSVLGLGK